MGTWTENNRNWMDAKAEISNQKNNSLLEKFPPITASSLTSSTYESLWNKLVRRPSRKTYRALFNLEFPPLPPFCLVPIFLGSPRIDHKALERLSVLPYLPGSMFPSAQTRRQTYPPSIVVSCMRPIPVGVGSVYYKLELGALSRRVIMKQSGLIVLFYFIINFIYLFFFCVFCLIL